MHVADDSVRVRIDDMGPVGLAYPANLYKRRAVHVQVYGVIGFLVLLLPLQFSIYLVVILACKFIFVYGIFVVRAERAYKRIVLGFAVLT